MSTIGDANTDLLVLLSRPPHREMDDLRKVKIDLEFAGSRAPSGEVMWTVETAFTAEDIALITDRQTPAAWKNVGVVNGIPWQVR